MNFKNLFFIFISFLPALSAQAARTDCVSQMALADISGNPITTSVDYEIHFYPTITGGAELTTAASGTVTPSNGILSLQFDCSTVTSNSAVFMEYVINSETLSPRVEMVSAPFAGTAFSVAGNSITLGTDTIGSYVESITAGSGISITGGAGEQAALTISATGTSLTAGSVTTTEISNGTIATVDLADGSITTAKLANDSVTSTKISDGTIVANDISNTLAGTGLLGGAGVPLAVDTTEINTSTWGSGAPFTWNMNSGAANPQFSFSNGVTTLLNSTWYVADCSAGYTNAGRFCIQTDEQTATDWSNAARTCQSSNSMLCSSAQWMAACLMGGLTHMIDGQEFVDDLADATNAITMGNGGCNPGFGTDNVFNSHPYRCCYTK
ncbi:MAG: hypothetical protein IPJ69_09725 [Deltaproteobacteria bacterium]|nr:MAG: hypothetical protein IPJ69_09725 [Deltaproteobacteria bacterium]